MRFTPPPKPISTTVGSIISLTSRRVLKYPRDFKTFVKDIVGLLFALIVWGLEVITLWVRFGFQVVLFLKERLWWSFFRQGFKGKWLVFAIAVGLLVIYGLGYDTVLLMLERSKIFEQVSFSSVQAQSAAAPVLAEEEMLLTDLGDNGVFTYYTYYTVQRGDTLSSIAKKFGIKVETLMWANKLSKYSRLKVGQKLKVPLADGVLHTVKKGETLEKIAKRYKSTVADIMEANWLDSPDDIKPGMELFVPKGTLPTEELQKLATRLSSKRTTVSYGRSTRSPVSNKCGNLPQFLTVWPVEGASRFSRGASRFHMAWDIISTSGQRNPYILAAGDGKVVFAGVDPCGYRRTRRCGYAWRVDIDHGNGYITRYAHMMAGSLMVRVGQYVKAGQRIGRMGDTGWATGIHLHFEVRRIGGDRLNPACFFK